MIVIHCSRQEPSSYLSFYPVWAYWGCFAPGSSARHTFFLFFISLHTVRDAPPWGTWLRTLHLWRKVRRYIRNRKKKKKKSEEEEEIERRRRKKPSKRRDLNPRPLDYEACYNRSPLVTLVAFNSSTLSGPSYKRNFATSAVAKV